MSIRSTGVVLVLIILLTVSLARAQKAETARLEIGKQVLRAISSGEAHTFDVAIKAGQFVEAWVDGRSTPVAVTASRPGGTVLDLGGPVSGPQGVMFVAAANGICRFTVASPQSGRYTIVLNAVRAVTAEDNPRIGAYSDLVAARRFAANGLAAEAAAAFHRALEKVQAGGDPFLHASALLGLGQLSRSAGDNAKSLDYFTRSAKLFESGGSWDEIFRDLSSLYLVLGGKSQAFEYLSNALPLVRALKNERLEAILLLAIARIAADMGRQPDVLESMERAVELLRLTAKRGPEAFSLTEISDADLTLEQKRQAISYLSQAALLSRGASDRALEATVLSGIGYVYSSIDEHENALKFFRRSLPLWHGLNDKSGEAYAVNFIGSTYLRLGDNSLAQQYLEQARMLFREIGDPRAEGYTQVSLAAIDSYSGEQQLAADRYRNALKLFQQTGETHGEALVLTCLGSINWARGQREASVANYEAALRLYRAEPDRLGEAIVLSNLGFIRQTSGQTPQAIELQTKALDLFRELGDRSGQANSLYGLARSKAAAGQMDAALTAITESIELIESIRGAIEADELKTSYLAAQHDVYAFLVDLLMRMNKERPGRGFDMQAFAAVENAKARSLVDVLYRSRTDVSVGLDPKLRGRERELRQQMNALTRTRSSTSDRKRIAEIDVQFDALTAEFQKLRAEIKSANPKYDSLTRPEPVTVQKVQALLDSDSVLLEYWLGDGASYVWMIKRDGVKAATLPPRSRIETAARGLYEAVKQPDNPALAAKAADELSAMIVSPAAAEIGVANILVVPDGILSYVPFAALMINGIPLIQQSRITHLPSASMLNELAGAANVRGQPQNSLAVFADPVFNAQDPRVGKATPPGTAPKPTPSVRPQIRQGQPSQFARLPGTRREANTILALAPGQDQKKALDFDANSEAIKSSDISRYRYVHIATHGILDSSRPEFSGVVLSLIDRDGQPQNGYLRLNDIYNLRLSADLVVLSACQTALGKEVKGEGLIGLTRGFMYAGSRRVVASLWPVDDIATAELMKVFYSGLFGEKKLSPSASLREAQLSLMKDRRFSDAYYWASFTLLGDPK